MTYFRRFLSRQKKIFFFKYTKQLFNYALSDPYYLDEMHFHKLLHRYRNASLETHQDYSEAGQIKLNNERIVELDNYISGSKIESVLEIGPGNGLLLNEFYKRGTRIVSGVDIENHFDKNVPAAIKLHLCGVHNMADIETNSMDLVYSFDALEHISEPETAINEVIRVTKPGGWIYLKIGPSYFSPWGYHFYTIAAIPYVQVLFSQKLLIEYSRSQKKPFPWTNCVPATEYLKLIKKLEQKVTLINLFYEYDINNMGVIREFPHVFKSKGLQFDDFLIGGITVVFRKDYIGYYRK